MPEAKRDDNGRVICRWRSERMVGRRRVQLRFAEVDGRITCIGLEIGPPLSADEASGDLRFDVLDDSELEELSTAEIRLPLRTLIEDSLAAAVGMLEGTHKWASPRVVEAADRSVAAYKPERKRIGRPPTWTPEKIEKTAQIYNDHLADGGRAPTRAVAKHFKVEKPTAAKLVQRARASGLIPPYA